MKRQIGIFAAVLLIALGVRAWGDYTATQGSGTTVFAFSCSAKVCPGSVPMTSAGVEILPATAAKQDTMISALTGALPAGANSIGATLGQTTQSGTTTNLISCDSHVFKHITSATDTLAVQGVSAKTIYICGWRSRAAGVATWFLENTASTNANCSSSNTQITGVATEAANTGEVMNPAYWSGLKNTSGNGLCINSTGTGGVDIDIWYTQF